MFDLDAFDKEVSNRFRNPERQGLSFQLKKQKTPIPCYQRNDLQWHDD